MDARLNDLSGLPIEKLHSIRQFIHRSTQPSNVLDFISKDTLSLDKNGIVKLPGFASPFFIQLKYDFEKFTEELEKKLRLGEGNLKHYDEELHYWPNDLAYVSNNTFKYSPTLVRFCCDKNLLNIVFSYLGKTAQVQRAVSMRYKPMKSTNVDMFSWHHDMNDRALKAMILLTDVGPGDQFMSYILGSNTLFHPYPMFLKNTCSLDYCKDKMKEVDEYRTVGKAGDVFLFDPNGAHKGNRFKTSSVRDAIFVEFSTDRTQNWGGDVDLGLLDELQNILGISTGHFDLMRRAEKRWSKPSTRKLPTWVETLKDVSLWL